ncbi:hypothetical protein DSUL_80067 [Desulfovibrionales bacterium]
MYNEDGGGCRLVFDCYFFYHNLSEERTIEDIYAAAYSVHDDQATSYDLIEY